MEYIDLSDFEVFWMYGSIPMALVSTENEFMRVNPAFERLTGYTQLELESKKWQAITLFDDIKDDEAMVREVLEGRRHQYAMNKTYIAKGGGTIPVKLHVCAKRNEQRKIEHFCVTAIPREVSSTPGSKLVTQEEGIKGISLKPFLSFRALAPTLAVLGMIFAWLVNNSVSRLKVEEQEKIIEAQKNRDAEQEKMLKELIESLEKSPPSKDG